MRPLIIVIILGLCVSQAACGDGQGRTMYVIIPESLYAEIPGMRQDARDYHQLMRDLEQRGVKVMGGGNSTYTIILPGEDFDRVNPPTATSWVDVWVWGTKE